MGDVPQEKIGSVDRAILRTLRAGALMTVDKHNMPRIGDRPVQPQDRYLLTERRLITRLDKTKAITTKGNGFTISEKGLAAIENTDPPENGLSKDARISCPNCGTAYKTPPISGTGKSLKTQCKKCGWKFYIVNCKDCDVIMTRDDFPGAQIFCPACESPMSIKKPAFVGNEQPLNTKNSNSGERRSETSIKEEFEKHEKFSAKNAETKKNYIFSWIVLIVCAFTVLYWLIHYNDSPKSPPSPDYRMSAIELMDEYKSNEIAADLKYKGKTVVVSGKVTDRAKDLLGHIYIALYTSPSIFSVQCFFKNKYAEDIAKIRLGTNLSIQGKVDGKMGNVIIKNCRIL